MNDDIDDAFERILMTEERLAEHGYHEGIQAGKISGYEKGFALGIKHGNEVNQEVGFYCGFAQTWLSLIDSVGGRSINTGSVKSVLNALLQLVDTFPLNEPQNADIQHQLRVIRDKFKQACSLLKVSPSSVQDADSGISF